MTTEINSNEQVDPRVNLYHNAFNGRGLWIGLFPTRPIQHDITPWLPNDAHITLAHLGRHDSEVVARHALTITHDALRWYHDRWNDEPIPGSITGCGWFWRRNEPTWIALVNSSPIFELRAKLIDSLKVMGVEFDEKFGFIPHITLEKGCPIT